MPPSIPDLPNAIHAQSPDYDHLRNRLTWNKRLAEARKPDLIVRARSVQDVADAIRFAAEKDLRVSPRCSGHHYEAAALREGGLFLDLGKLERIVIEPDARTAWVGAGVKGGALIERLAADGFAFPIGHCADVAIGGYVLAGGFGWNSGEWGPACANVRAIEMVTACGEMIVASESDHADLFWAARGGGPGFFAAITAYCLELRPLPLAAFAWSWTFASKSAPALADWLTSATAAADRSTEVICLIGTDPRERRPSVTVRAVACADSEDEARGRIASFVSPPAAGEEIAEMEEETLPFAELTKFSAMPADKRVAADHLWSGAPMGDLLLAAYEFAAAPSALSTINLVYQGGNGQVPSMPGGLDAALSVGGGAGVGIYAMWDDPGDDAANIGWVREVDDTLAPMRSGRYVGEADVTVAPDRLEECFSPEALERLSRLRSRYDPKGLFFTWP